MWRFTFFYPAMNFCHTPSFTPLCHTPPFTHNFHTHDLSHTIFDTYIIFFVAHHLSHTTLSRTTLHIQLVLLLDPPPPSSSFLPSPSLLQHFLLIIGRSWLVGLSGPLISMPKRQKHCKFTVLLPLAGTKKNQQTSIKKCPQWTFQTLLSSKPRFYPCYAAQKRENTTRVKILGGGAARLSDPRKQPCQ